MLASAFSPPPLPAWDAAHVVVVHLPIGVLIAAPLLILLGLLPRVGRAFCWAALLLLALGTAGTYLAVATGDAAAELVDRTVPNADRMQAVLEAHQEQAELARTLLTVLTVLYAGLLLVPELLTRGVWRRRPVRLPPAAVRAAHVVFLLAYLVVLLLVANTAHLGGRLVHEFGQHAWLTPG